MSNPAINRWGSTTYWNRLWYSDTHYALNLKQDRAFEHMIHSYLAYGTRVGQPLFYSPFWYLCTNNFPNWPSFQKSYFRWFVKKELLDNERPSYRLRNEYIDAYYMRLWILKFDHWVIFNLYWFQPLTGKRLAKRRPREFFFFQPTTAASALSYRRSRAAILAALFMHWSTHQKYYF